MAWPAGREGSVEVAWALERGEEGPPVVYRQIQVSNRMVAYAWALTWVDEGPPYVCRQFEVSRWMIAWAQAWG